MKTPEQNKEEFDKMQILMFAEEREEIITFVRQLCAANNLGDDYVDSFIARLDRLIDIGRYLVIKDSYMQDIKQMIDGEKERKNNFFDGVDLNALD